MKHNILDKLSQNAVIGALLIFISFLLLYAFKDILVCHLGSWFLILFFIFCLYGMYLLFPYITHLFNPNNPWNKK